ncbi:DUF1684 domain-containing protein [Leptobacterium flavescens]|uniref:DUF1684 domain-containing protein n=1 Tax=Leptobacterium flavescens TaxID=472055 RepID=A0A6P0UQ28_9FLAO|nr:DUF1684 domain-containing protein [Leptobacterium flavescens]NER15441.1 DUF1684 domain-containing protein [Leptobacterium flavescens]
MMKNFYLVIALLMLFSCNNGKKYHDNQQVELFEEVEEQEDALSDIRKFQRKLNKEFKDPETSPLTDKDRIGFNGLDFFPIDTTYRVKATLVRTPDELPFLMPTTTSRKSHEVKYGELHFTIEGKELVLNVYQNQQLKLTQEYKDYLFLPYTDETNGTETYGGGRYIDLSVPEGDTLILDFNKSYNPYCVYNPKYSCPIVPGENRLDVDIKAGVKDYEK